jgi:hypothetical protein
MKYRRPLSNLTKGQLRAQSEAAMKEARDRKLPIQQLESRKDVRCGCFSCRRACPTRTSS